MQGTIMDAIRASRDARLRLRAAKASVAKADRAVKDVLTDKDVVLSGWTTHRRQPPSANTPERKHLTAYAAHVDAVFYSLTIDDGGDEQDDDTMWVTLSDGTMWCMSIHTATIVLADEHQSV